MKTRRRESTAERTVHPNGETWKIELTEELVGGNLEAGSSINHKIRRHADEREL